MICPRCSSKEMQRMTEDLSLNQTWWCGTCLGWVAHILRNGKLFIEFADWRSNGWKEAC